MATEPTESEPTPFTLNYAKRTIFRFIRKGTVEEPFPTEISCKDLEEYIKRSSEKKMQRNKRKRGPPDFYKDENGMIIYREGPEGLSTYRNKEQFLANWRGKPITDEKLWMLKESTPVPKEIELMIDPADPDHILIKPAKPPYADPGTKPPTVTPERFKQMLGCLYWVKYREYGDR